MNSVKKRIRLDTFFIIFICFFMFSLSGGSIYQAIKSQCKAASAYELKLVEDENSKGSYYALFIDGEEYQFVDFNEYGQPDSTGKANPQKALLIEHITKAIRLLLIGLSLIFIGFALMKVREGETPFSKKVITYLRISALLIIILGILPGAIKVFLRLIYFENVFISFSLKDIFIIVLGIIVGVISEIFVYGKELQDEMNQIA